MNIFRPTAAPISHGFDPFDGFAVGMHQHQPDDPFFLSVLAFQNGTSASNAPE